MSGTTEIKARPPPVRTGKGKGTGKGTGKGKGKGKGKGTGKGKGKGKGNLTRGSISLNNVGSNRVRRPPPVRRGTQNNVRTQNVSVKVRRPPPVRSRTQNNVSAKNKIAFTIARRKATNQRANTDAMEELKTLGLKNHLTFKQRKALRQKEKKGTHMNAPFKHFGMYKKNHTNVNHDLLRDMNIHIPKGLNKPERKLYVDTYKRTLKNFYDKHVIHLPDGQLSYRPESPTDSPITPSKSNSPTYFPKDSPPSRSNSPFYNSKDSPPSPIYIPKDSPPYYELRYPKESS